MSEDEQITFHMDGILASTDATGGIVGIDISFAQAPFPPEAILAYRKEGEESDGVIQVIKTIIAEVDKEIQVMQLDEKGTRTSYLEPIDAL